MRATEHVTICARDAVVDMLLDGEDDATLVRRHAASRDQGVARGGGGDGQMGGQREETGQTAQGGIVTVYENGHFHKFHA